MATRASTRWTPSPLLKASAALHLGAVALAVARPGLWPWALGAVILNHLQLTATGLWPRSTLLGPNLTRLPAAAALRGEVALSIDDGPDPAVTPKVLRVLDEHGAKATFFCVGTRVEEHAELAREIVQRGHAIENHSYRHLNYFSVLPPRALAYEIERAQEAIGAITGRRPLFFRAPAGLRSPLLDPILTRLELLLASWTRRGFDSVNGNPESVYARLTTGLAAGDILLLHDGHAARTRSGSPVILEVLPRLLALFAQSGLTTVRLSAALA
ncbi:MAG TPA: polysaccharide deacetylase family protein [Steroidobacteraceae bacterium]|jgi:peptidoglycan/xylan/chitin deacetylase (PgdA/CDA1 family)|nr:polysaccharide deacetylase family protein [Steroidobacteraceae bacterium]